ncbi:SusD/RagB family nutrient-binding outer membrane lipoprotein [Cesiribacter sp. SM1]|uniref:SusD/RagB family nutrient-binding outer membrane lipoprotein n=1 Tax=Cesiribacter sp. SM1 TaxID=2861196 RepID=UPI001CD7C345|nr:SusD/RagB family nutrient-binding outer membrane lipoprotein [Cesiribacter sp. SM1]
MKKISLYIIGALAAVVSLSACKDELEDKFYNPDQTTSQSIGGFFTEMLDNDRVRPNYWELRTFIVMHPGIYTQSVAYLNGNSVFQQNGSYTQDRWQDFYRPGGNGGGVMAHYRAIQNAYESLSEEEKNANRIFLEAAKVVMLDQASQMVDLWGDIPFSEAGSLNLTGKVVRPKFDRAEDVYAAILSGLKEASDYMATASTNASFQRQDILLQGNVDQWRRYANSLRLRLLMRTSFVDEAGAKQQVMEMLNNPGQYPLVDEPEYNVLLSPLTNNTNDLRNAMTELTNYSAPEFMLEEVLKPANDPRIPVLFDKNTGNTEYRGLPQNLGSEQQQQNIGMYAVIDSSTFLLNSKLPGIVITAAEVNLLKAEAFERWGGGDAQAAYEQALEQSVRFYYYLNSLNANPKAPLTPPTAEEMNSFLAEPAVAYAGTQEEKLEKIWTQKWVHFGFLQSVQSWSELRRTGYPDLTFTPATMPGYELPPLRLVYPDSEKAFNADNYEQVRAKDLRDTEIFWDVQ